MKPRVFIGAVLVVTIAFMTGGAMAAAPPTPDLLDRLAALEVTVQALQAKVTTLETEVATMKSSQVMALNNYLTVTTGDKPRALLSGLNLQLVNGTGRTDMVNGRGNLILGYDLAQDDQRYFCSDGQFTSKEPCERSGQTWAISHKTGSHYLVIGDWNNYAQYGGLVVGAYNTSTGPAASVTGGMLNTASGSFATVSGGSWNTASGPDASITGGTGNTASGFFTTVSGGSGNTASGPAASVSGGGSNTASGSDATVSGGGWNTASETIASVSGGQGNLASRT
ncbi:MAG: hypothetical protein ACM362_15210, partial [Candidatus Methylomirabilota bacterium]